MDRASELIILCESLLARRKIVVRDAKRVKKIICGRGKKAVQGICQMQSGEEKRSQKIGHLKARTKLKIAGRSAQTQHKREFSLRKRKILGL